MTDIKSAIDIMKNEMPHCGTKLVYTEEERTEAYTLAIRSLRSWEEVLQELEKERDFFTNIRGEYGRGAVFANSKAIDIINQHLEIKEGEEYERI